MTSVRTFNEPKVWTLKWRREKNLKWNENIIEKKNAREKEKEKWNCEAN